jgi:hypothetical protein
MSDHSHFETRPDLQRSWSDHSFDWTMGLLFVLVLLAIIGLWTYADHPQTAAIPDDATTGQSTRPGVPNFPN